MTTPEDKSRDFRYLNSNYDPTRSFGGDSSQGDNLNPFRLRVESFIKRVDPESEPDRMDIGEIMDHLKPYPVLQGLFMETLTDEQYLNYIRSLPESD